MSSSYKTMCDYCHRDIEIEPPYVSDHPEYFWAKCPYNDCKGLIKLYFFKGKITSKKPAISFHISLQVSASDNVLNDVLRVVSEGVENEYMEHLRGAAVIYRVAAEMLALGKALGFPFDGSVPLIGFSSALKAIATGRRGPQLSISDRSLLVDKLQYVKNMGDTAAHRVISDPARIVPSIPSNMYEARRSLKEAIEILV